MSSAGTRLLSGALWSYGLQLATVVAQLGYAATTSRIASPSAFGDYSVALSIMALVNLLGSGGLSQTAARTPEVSAQHTRPLAAYALALGTAAAIFTLATNSLWVALWRAPSASGTVNVLALSAFIVPILSLCNGIFRRLGKFRSLALITFLSNVIGMIVGLFFVGLFRSPESLAVSAIVGQFGTAGWAIWKLRNLLVPSKFSFRAESILFSTKLVAISVVQYVSGNGPRWSVSHFVGTATLGAWNRADVLTTIPFSQVQAALLQVIYPEFRRYQPGTPEARQAWLDMLTLTSWLTLPAGAVVAAVGPPMTEILLGPGWGQAAAFIPILAVLGGIQPLVMLLSAALESSALFKPIWLSECVALLLSLAGAVYVSLHQFGLAALITMAAASFVRHAIHIGYAVRVRALPGLQIFKVYVFAVTFAASLFLSLSLIVAPRPATSVTQIGGALLLLAIVAGCALLRHRLPPILVARRRHMFAFKPGEKMEVER